MSVSEENSRVDADSTDGVVVSVVAARSAARSSSNSRPPHVVGLVTPRLPQENNDTRELLADDDDDEPPVTSNEDDFLVSCELYASHQELNEGISWYKAVFLIVNAALGAGLLNFPRAFDEAGGIVVGNVVHVVFTLTALGALVIIGKCGNQRNVRTYQELVLEMCNPGWNVAASVCISVYCFVTCITFIIIIGDQFDRVFASFVGHEFCHLWYLNRKFTMTVSSLLLIFPCCFKRIDGLRYMSYIGVVTIWYVVAVIVGEYYTGDYEKGPVSIAELHWSQIFDVVPTICFGYQCHVSSIPIYSCLKQRDASTFIKACSSAIFVCLSVYTISANYGYLTFGALVDGDVLLSYDATKPQVLIAVILLALKSWTTYPILLFCVREAVGDLYVQTRSLTPLEAINNEPNRRKIIAIVLWATTILLAVFTPNINIVVKLLGSLAAIFIFVFPGICLLQLVLAKEIHHPVRSWCDVMLIVVAGGYIVLGMFAFGLAFTLGIQHIVTPDNVQPLCI